MNQSISTNYILQILRKFALWKNNGTPKWYSMVYEKSHMETHVTPMQARTKQNETGFENYLNHQNYI